MLFRFPKCIFKVPESSTPNESYAFLDTGFPAWRTMMLVAWEKEKRDVADYLTFDLLSTFCSSVNQRLLEDDLTLSPLP
jgi:hypothetical protein